MMAAATVDILEDALLKSMEQRLLLLLGDSSDLHGPRTIFRVFPTVREEDGAAYDPKIIAIGPYQQDKDCIKPMEEVKWRFLSRLLGRSPRNKLENYLRLVRSLEPRARKQYSEKLKCGVDALVEMLVLDGCFIVELLVEIVLDDRDRQLYEVNWKLPLLRSDLLLLENQIPFFVLESLFSSTTVPEFYLDDNEEPITLKELALSYVTQGRLEKLPEPVRQLQVHHLLHLFQLSLTPSSPEAKKVEFLWHWFEKIKRFISDLLFWLLSFVLYCFALMQRRPRHLLPTSRVGARAPRMIPSATELQEAGVVFKKKEGASCFLDVRFGDGAMEIPRLSIQAATISEFRNLIAFEQCCPDAGSHFTSYAAFMDNLINTPMDVALLQDCGVIESKLGSEKEVNIFFNRLCKGGYLDYEMHYLVGLYKDVRAYCELERHRWRATLVHDYFSNPWAIISFVAAVVLLGLTIVQTVFTILAYVHPRS